MASPVVHLLPIVVVFFLAATSLWVYQDASAHLKRGALVRFTVGSLEVDTPVIWAVGCLCMWIIFMPLYLTCRRQAD
jgi:hypothetical protein